VAGGGPDRHTRRAYPVRRAGAVALVRRRVTQHVRATWSWPRSTTRRPRWSGSRPRGGRDDGEVVRVDFLNGASGARARRSARLLNDLHLHLLRRISEQAGGYQRPARRGRAAGGRDNGRDRARGRV
jgi:hypothetical protein